MTVEMVKELKKLTGIRQFEPEDTVSVTVYLGNYALETEMVGIDLAKYPLRWKSALPEVAMGNTPALFLGEEVLSFFSDQRGHSPGKSEIKAWMERYQEVELTIADENGRRIKANFCGILMQPGDKICMEKNQMEEIFSDQARVRGGFLIIQGYQNAKKAGGLLEDAGISAEEICFDRPGAFLLR